MTSRKKINELQGQVSKFIDGVSKPQSNFGGSLQGLGFYAKCAKCGGMRIIKKCSGKGIEDFSGSGIEGFDGSGIEGFDGSGIEGFDGSGSRSGGIEDFSGSGSRSGGSRSGGKCSGGSRSGGSRSGGKCSAKKSSNWIDHVKQYAKENGISYREALSEAKSTYRSGGAFIGSNNDRVGDRIYQG